MKSGASQFVRDLFEYARDQGWAVNPKGDHRYVFVAPNGHARPGMAAIAVDDPFSDSHSQKVIRNRLKSAGLKLETEEEKPKSMATSKPNATSPYLEITDPEQIESRLLYLEDESRKRKLKIGELQEFSDLIKKRPPPTIQQQIEVNFQLLQMFTDCAVENLSSMEEVCSKLRGLINLHKTVDAKDVDAFETFKKFRAMLKD